MFLSFFPQEHAFCFIEQTILSVNVYICIYFLFPNIYGNIELNSYIYFDIWEIYLHYT